MKNLLKNKAHNQKGFTLIELLVVIAIIGFISSIVMSSLVQARVKAKDTKRRSDLRQLQIALENYYDDHGSYPSTKSGSSLRWVDSIHCPDNWIPGLVPKYIAALPKEPDQNSTLCLADSPPQAGDFFGTSYRYKSDGVSYKIHDHCAPISSGMTNINDNFAHCSASGGGDHPNSWSVCGGPIPCSTLWCAYDTSGSSVTNAENEKQSTGC